MNIDVSATRQQLGLYPETYLAINGEERRGGGRETRDVISPVTGEVLGQVPLASKSDLQDALIAAQKGFALWSAETAYHRSSVLRKAADWMRTNRDEGARRISLELGKVFSEALSEIDLAASLFEWSADEAPRAYGRIIPGRRPGLHLEARVRPIGPVYAVSSWNAPAVTPTRKLCGALAAGCSVILKLSDQVPASGLFLYEALKAAGLPAGVAQVITGRGAEVSDAIIPSEVIRLVTLTGSIDLGRRLASQAASHLKPQTMELGGHAPVIVHHDVDVSTVARAAARAKFRNVGQVCTAPTRFYIHKNVSAQFTQEFVAETNQLVVGDPFATGSQIGPVQNERHLTDIESLVSDAVAKGATLACGGKRLSENGYFFTPTVLTNVPADANVHTVEPFGPIAVIEEYSDLNDAVKRSNALDVGLSAYGFTGSAAVANHLASSLDAGNIILNNWNSSYPETPFGGVRDSGYGKEGGSEGLQEFLTTVFISNEFIGLPEGTQS